MPGGPMPGGPPSNGGLKKGVNKMLPPNIVKNVAKLMTALLPVHVPAHHAPRPPVHGVSAPATISCLLPLLLARRRRGGHRARAHAGVSHTHAHGAAHHAGAAWVGQ